MFALAPLVGMAHRMFPPRLRRGTRHPDAPLSPCFAAESVRADTLRAHPENTARHLGWPSVRGGAVSSERDIRVPEAKRGRVPL